MVYYRERSLLWRCFNLEWKSNPMHLSEWEGNIDYILSIDENGTPNLNNITEDNKWFTLTGILLDKEQFVSLRDEISRVKFKYWKDGLFKKKRIVFHSREIRKKIGPFNPKIVKLEELTSDLHLSMKNLEYQVFTSSIDKLEHTSRYLYPYPVYDFCLEFVLERYAMYLENYGKKGIIVMESRGRRENKALLSSAVRILENGNRYYGSEKFKNILGIYFNPKRTDDNKLSYPQIEFSDLVGYEIYDYIRSGKKSSLFLEIEKSIYNYPRHSGYGMKIFP